MADKLDIDQALMEFDPQTKEMKATPYFEDYLFQFVNDLGGEGSSPIPGLLSDASRKADTLLFAVLDKVSLGDPVTVDTTGFTVDSTEFTADMTES